MIEIDVITAAGYSKIKIIDGERIHRLTIQGGKTNLELYKNLISEYYPTDISIIGYLEMDELNELVEFIEEFDKSINIDFKETIIQEDE